MEVTERDEAGHIFRIRVEDSKAAQLLPDQNTKNNGTSRPSFLSFLTRVFLPSGYPRSVSPDYLRYQILNALQAFCSSLTSLLSSRATLEGYGVGDASASATNALLLTVLQDIFGRLTTILGAFFFGSSLFPEAKKYRFLADVLNDAATIIDTLSPLLVSLYDTYAPSIATSLPFLPPTVPLRVYTLCASASLRALCGIAAGGSKTAITMHFATPLEGTGDAGDLNAKDSSKETILALFGMLIGTIAVPYLTTPWSTYTVLFLMVSLHLFINYIAVRGIVLRSMNRQRACLAWVLFKSERSLPITPSHLATLEHLLMHSDDDIRSYPSGNKIGQCTMGSSFSACYSNPETIALFAHKRYILCLDKKSSLVVGKAPHLHILLKDGYNSADQLQAWLLACEVARIFASHPSETRMTVLIKDAIASVDKDYATFMEDMQKHGWVTVALSSNGSTSSKDESDYHSPALLPGSQTLSFTVGSPKSVILDFQPSREGKKSQ
ncbi:vitamin B6 photo-protection and homoeostasis-domain-containing protein [Rhodocollybia butyracea]|uniref:Vitamin B6 photo-protection and homoeostasis-domain-containing protein n=1 Tax=Rhodocollybia butyracea TaxID=206335 RepID=A0A9P5UGZ8_9AGAR|nr:vitamin B6 photo-protection and homoeostasis-domain-containing protein [Rhodocollybia butyracea]